MQLKAVFYRVRGICLLLGCCLLLLSCQPSRSGQEAPAAQANERTASSAAEALPEQDALGRAKAEEAMQQAGDPALGKYFWDENEEQKALYREAFQWLEAQRQIKGRLSSGYRFKTYYLLSVLLESGEQESLALDAEISPVETYLVDLASQKVISRGDFESLYAIYDEYGAWILGKQGASWTEMDRREHLKPLLALTSTLAFGHADFIEEPWDPRTSEPKIEGLAQGFKVEYYIYTGRGREISFDRCVLRVEKDKISFQREPVD